MFFANNICCANDKTAPKTAPNQSTATYIIFLLFAIIYEPSFFTANASYANIVNAHLNHTIVISID